MTEKIDWHGLPNRDARRFNKLRVIPARLSFRLGGSGPDVFGLTPFASKRQIDSALLNRPFLLVAALSLLPWSIQGLRAQQFSAQTAAGQIERARLPNPTLPLAPGSLASGEPAESGNTENSTAPATSGDNDLGVQSLLRAPEQRKPWTLFADGGFVYTTNVALTQRNQQDDVFFVGEGGAGYDFKLTPDLNLAASVRQQYFAYDTFDQLDFGSLNFGLGLSYTVHQLHDIVLSAQLGYTRLTRHGVWDNEFFRDGSLDLGAQKLFTFGRAQLLSIGFDVGLNISVPHVAEREEFGLSSGYILQVTRHLSVQAGGRVAYYLYASSGRQDFNFAGSAGATYEFTPWCSVGASISGVVDRSDRHVFDYDVFNTGVSTFFRLKF